MYHLLKGAYEYYKYVPISTYNVLILGLDNSGKTTLLEQLKHIYNGTAPASPSSITPTIGQNIGKISCEGKQLLFWDLGGQISLRRIWKEYYSSCHAILFIIDATDFERIDECRETLESAMDDFEAQVKSIDEGVPIMVLANKFDKEGAISIEDLKARGVTRIFERLSARDSCVMSISALLG